LYVHLERKVAAHSFVCSLGLEFVL
jgi:hypothetical protein